MTHLAAPPAPATPRGVPQASETAFRSLIKTLGLLKRVMEPHFARFGISGSHWAVLRTLHRSEEEGHPALRQTDLGDRLVVRPASVTGVIDRLQRMGLVARTASPDDHRAKIVQLTEEGRQLVQRVLLHHPAQTARVLQGLSAPEQGELARLLNQLSSHLEHLAADTDAAPAASTPDRVGSSEGVNPQHPTP